MSKNMGKFPLLDRRSATLASMQGCGGGESKASGASIGGECSEYGWVKSGGVAPLSWGVSAVLASALEISVGLSLLVWVNIYLGE